jgi:transposase
LAGIERDAPRGGRTPSVRGAMEAEIIRKTTRETPQVLSWLKRHPRFHQHFTPTSGTWLNVIERWFRDLTQNRIRNGVFKSVAELEQTINHYIHHHNTHPKSFV